MERFRTVNVSDMLAQQTNDQLALSPIVIENGHITTGSSGQGANLSVAEIRMDHVNQGRTHQHAMVRPTWTSTTLRFNHCSIGCLAAASRISRRIGHDNGTGSGFCDNFTQYQIPPPSCSDAGGQINQRESARFFHALTVRIRDDSGQWPRLRRGHWNWILNDLLRKSIDNVTVVTRAEDIALASLFGRSPDIKVGRSPGRSDPELCDFRGRNRCDRHGFWSGGAISQSSTTFRTCLCRWRPPTQAPLNGWGGICVERTGTKSRRKVFRSMRLPVTRMVRWAGDTAQG